MVCSGVAVASNLAQGNWKGAAVAATGAAFGAARLVTKASAIAKIAKATASNGNAGFGILKARPLTAKLAGRMYAKGGEGLRGFRISEKKYGNKVANFEQFKKSIGNVSRNSNLRKYPNRAQNLHLKIGGWLW